MKLLFNLETVLTRIEQAIAKYPKAAMFELYERGFTSLFEQLVSCIISVRTMDETTIPVSLRLFDQARTPQAMLLLPHENLTQLLYGSSFPGQKAETMLGIAKVAIEKYNGQLPASFDDLIALKGVGPKCANLALGVAAKLPAISVDIHVHRVVNRWGITQTTQPEQTMLFLQKTIPQEKWIDVNRLLMPFGKHICTGVLPHCSTCPVLEYCEQVGVMKHR
ncbi:endonuclease III [uncultured Mucilaginibacter sp.]|uniref:endonuclease III domain-containing protein n=1 Tax=uncultured Mucilaginibacter sp. TaxID=797541 RepID=UPI0026228BB8|nr:endonuclease III [uncultured Mucilaginibacter sp.]